MKKRNPNKLNMVLLCVTAVVAALLAAAIYFVHAGLFAAAPDNHFYMPLFMGLLFAALLLVISLVVLAVSSLRRNYRADVITGMHSKGRIVMYLLGGILAMALFIFGAEFLYECNLQIFGNSSGGTYVFLIDDSGTMDDNDPDLLRYEAISSILSGKSAKTNYTVYTFSDYGKLVVPMRTVGEGFMQYPEPDFGLTNMKAGLEKVVTDFENGVWTSKGEASLILITDGGPTDFYEISEVQDLLDRCVANNINLGIVGVIGANNDLMQEMATYTGGTFVDIKDITQLNDAIREVSGETGFTRDLLTERDDVSADWLYALIRVLAIAVAGIVIAVCAALCYGNSKAFSFIIGANGVKAVLAGILMEVAFLIPLLSPILCMAALTLLGTILAKEGDDREGNKGDPDIFDPFTTKSKKTEGYTLK